MIFFIIGLLFCLGQLGRISIVGSEVNIYVYEIGIILHVLYLIFKLGHTPLIAFFKKIKILLLLFSWILISFGITSISYTLFQNVVAFLYIIRVLIYFIWGILLYYDSKKFNEQNNLKFVYGWFCIILFISFIQFFLYPDLVNLRYLGWDMHYNRLFSVFFDTSTTGAIFGILFWFLIILKKKFKKSIPYFLLLFGILLCGILTFSRNYYISFILSLLVYGLIQKNWKLVIGFLFSFVILVIIVPKNFGPGVGLNRLFTIQSRFVEYQKAFELWKTSPFFGIGYNRIKYVREQVGQIESKTVYPLHSAASFSSSFAILFATTGVIGIVLLCTFFVTIGLSHVFLIPLLVFVGIMSVGDNILLHPFVLFLLAGYSFLNRLFEK